MTSAQLTLDLSTLADGPLAPVAREAISIWWEQPDPEPQTTDEHIHALSVELRRQEDISRWLSNEHKAVVDELLLLRSYIQAVAEGSETFLHRASRFQRTTAEEDAKGIWRYILASAEANRAMEDAVMGPHRPLPVPPTLPPQDIRGFAWDECQVYRHQAASEWRIGWRGGDVCVLRPYSVEAMQATVGPFWDILSFPGRAKAQAELDRYRADVDAVRREWEALRAAPTGNPTEDDR